jgi:tRNA-splicing ligase RtcB
MTCHRTQTFSDRASIVYWTDDLPIDPKAQRQLEMLALMPFIYQHIAVMPDVHAGKGSTIGSVIATDGAIIPAAVGVDIGCGMMAIQTQIKKHELPKDLTQLRYAIEKAIPHGRKPSKHDPGSWHDIPDIVNKYWENELIKDYKRIIEQHPQLKEANAVNHLGTLGTGNHFVEISYDENDAIWFVIHSGSRGIGNAIGSYFIKAAQSI